MGEETRTSIWLDCDTGHDDAYAILLAAYHPRSRLLGVSTVHGNASVLHTTVNTCGILEAIGRPEVQVIQGESKPLVREPLHAPEYHGESGLGGVSLLPDQSMSQNVKVKSGIEEMLPLLMAEPENSVCIVPTGPLTNIAKLIREYPDVLSRIANIGIMGGGIGGGFSQAPMHRLDGPGNWTRFAEFNIFCDPEAASYLVSHPQLASKITLIALDCTHHCRATPQVLEQLSGPSKLRRLMIEILTFFADSYKIHSTMTDGPPLHDPLAALAMLEPQMFDDGDGERWKIDVCIEGDELGRTVLQAPARTDESERRYGHRVPRGVEVDSFWRIIQDCLESAEKVASF